MSTSPNEGTLLATTRRLLQQTSETYLDIFKATELTPNWLSSLSRGHLVDPSVNKVQKLYEHLTRKTLVKGS